MRKSIYLILVVFLTVFSCKEKDVTIEPISLPNAESILEGKWEILFAKAEGTARIGNGSFPVTGSNTNVPEGYYDIKIGDKENTYDYDVKVKLIMEFGENTSKTINYDYDDRDAGTWELKSDEMVTLYANQGNVQDVFFTYYDSLEVQHLQFSLPVDTVLESVDYNGKVVLDMIKIQ